MHNYFFSDKNLFEDESKRIEIAEFFPVVGISSSSGIFFHKEDCAVGCILSISQCRPEQLEKIGRCISKWLRTSALVTLQNAFTISVQKKLTANFESDEEISLKPEALISISVASLKTFISGEDPAEHSKLPDKKTELTLLNCELLSKAVTEFTSLLRKERIIARLIDAKDKALNISRNFWSASKALKPMDFSEAPGKYFSSGLSLHHSRTFWKDNDSFKMMFSLKVPSPELTSKNGEIDKDDFVGNILGMNDVLLSGLLVFILSAGGPDSKSEETSIAGILKENGLLGDEPAEEDDEGFQLRLSVNFISQMPWSETVGHFLGKYTEAKELLELENMVLNELSDSSAGGDWSLVDSTWLDVLYSIVPGATRLDKNNIQKHFEIIHIL